MDGGKEALANLRSGRVDAARAHDRAHMVLVYSKESANRTSDISSLFGPSALSALPSPVPLIPSFLSTFSPARVFEAAFVSYLPAIYGKLDVLSLPAAANIQSR